MTYPSHSIPDRNLTYQFIDQSPEYEMLNLTKFFNAQFQG